MGTEERPPEQVIREWLDAHGPATVGLDAIAATWRLDHVEAADRRRIATALETAGVVVEPPISRAGAREKLRLSVAEQAPARAPAPAGDAPPPAGVTSPEPARESPESATRGDSTPPQGVKSPEPAGKRPLAARLAPVAIGLMVLGALGPWSKAVFVTDYGTERAGWAVLAVAVVAAVLLLVHASRGYRSAMPLLVAVLGTFTVALVASELRELSEDEFVGPAWGAYVAFAGSAGLVLSSVALLARRS